MKLRNRFWLWGQDANSHQESPANEVWKLPQGNTVDAARGAEYFGIPNICRVVMNGLPQPPFDAESEKLKKFDQVVWSAIGDWGSERNNQATDLNEVLRQADKFPNITGAVLDDFFCVPTEKDPRVARYSVETIREMSERLHRHPVRRLDLWLVWYKVQLELDLSEYLKCFDVITFWNMNSVNDHESLPEKFQRFIELTPGKRRYAGFYLWDYGNGRPLTQAEFAYEAEIYYNLLKNGEIEGIVFCSNCCCGFGIESVEVARQWILEKGNEDWPD